MGISAPVYTSQYANYVASPRTFVPSSDWGSKLRVSIGQLTFTAAGFTTASAGDLTLIRMPSGPIRIICALSRITCPVGTATSDLDVGYGAHTTHLGVAVNADGDAFAASLDVGNAAIDAAFSLPAAGYVEFNTLSGFDIVASFDTANSPAAGVLAVIVAYQIGN